MFPGLPAGLRERRLEGVHPAPGLDREGEDLVAGDVPLLGQPGRGLEDLLGEIERDGTHASPAIGTVIAKKTAGPATLGAYEDTELLLKTIFA